MSSISSKLLKRNEEKKVEEALQFISFNAGDEVFAIDILKIHEITSYKELTRVPSLPPFVKGVLNLRGMVVPVMDLREKFSFEHKEYTKFSVIMIIDVAGRIMGTIVDSVADVLQVHREEIQPPPKFSGRIKAEFIRGMLRKGEDKFIILLDMDKILSDEELDIMDSI